MKSHLGLIALAVLGLAGGASAEIVDSQPYGFTVRETQVISAPPAKVWAALVQPALWWSPDHTFSHDARNLSLSPTPGGAWLESLHGGGGVRHLVVIYVDPPKTLRLEGPLGPLQDFGVAGHLTFALTAEGQGTRIVETYDVGGHEPGGLDRIVAPVDRVLGEQLSRLKACVETGKTPG